MTTTQLVLDLWPVDTQRHDWAAHQQGRVLLPWDCLAGREGNPVPAWICCRCGLAELSEFSLVINHHCDAYQPWCQTSPQMLRYPLIPERTETP